MRGSAAAGSTWITQSGMNNIWPHPLCAQHAESPHTFD
jgi:hypothetical protein